MKVRAGILVSFLLTVTLSWATDRPNVIIVMTDDQGYGDLGCHGNSRIKTPNLDALHSQSVRLTDFHVDPTCAPTRAALLTGRYSSRTGVWHTIMGRSLLDPSELTLAEILKANGYATAMVGKWHLGDNYPLRPQDQGFDHVLVHGGGGIGQTPDYWGNDYFDDTYFQNGSPVPFSGYCTKVFFDAAIKFVEQERPRPFFLYLTPNVPHSPYRVPESYRDEYLAKGLADPMASFYGMISHFDEQMGRLLAALDGKGLSENTILLFLTDNGTAAGFGKRSRADDWPGFNAGMRGTKGSEYEGGHRVPCFIRWPKGGLATGRDVNALTAQIDLLPTVLDLCGVARPDAVAFDGQSLAQLLREGTPIPARTLFVHSQRVDEPIKWRKSAVMNGHWRLVNGRELYQVQADPAQSQDLAGTHPERVQEMRAEYDRWWESLLPAFEKSVAIEIGSNHQNPTELTCHDWHAPENQIPWNQTMVAADPLANGYWDVRVGRPGRYRITLRQRPAHVSKALDAVQARLRIGTHEWNVPVPENATEAVFNVELEPGETTLQSWLVKANGQSRGAFFVSIARE